MQFPTSPASLVIQCFAKLSIQIENQFSSSLWIHINTSASMNKYAYTQCVFHVLFSEWNISITSITYGYNEFEIHVKQKASSSWMKKESVKIIKNFQEKLWFAVLKKKLISLTICRKWVEVNQWFIRTVLTSNLNIECWTFNVLY